MSEFYKPQRQKNLYDPAGEKPFKISRSKIENFRRCPRCFYIDRRLGISPPPGFPFTLNSAVDSLLKREFDHYRSRKQAHPVMRKHKIKCIPFSHPELETWRDSLRGGLQFHHAETNLIITGGIDDVWIDEDGWLAVVDYKATSKRGAVDISAEWQQGYKRQMEIYQWLLRRLGFQVSDVGYFVYCNGNSDAPKFDQQLSFEISVLPYSGNDAWVEDCLFDIFNLLRENQVPELSGSCDHCAYISALRKVEVLQFQC